MSYPNGQATNYSYFGRSGDQRLQEISNLTPTSAVLSKFDYTYNPAGDILTWTQQADPITLTNTPKMYTFGYDNADRLLSATLQDTGTSAILHQYVYGYDAAANRTSSQLDSQVNSVTPNGLNQIVSTQGGGPMQFNGTLSAPAKVTVGGKPATVSGLTYTGNANVTTGSNTVAITATNAGGSTTHGFQVTVTGAAVQPFAYDPNGNLLGDGTKTYQWDAANRLVGIGYVGSGAQTQMKYDGAGRRVAIVESTSRTVTSTKNFVWTGVSLAEERDASGAVMKRCYSQGEQISGAAYYFSRDHLGSIREMTDAIGGAQVRYDFDPYGVRTRVSVHNASGSDLEV